jgi:RNA polymerase sigma factor (sigma-70 family)
MATTRKQAVPLGGADAPSVADAEAPARQALERGDHPRALELLMELWGETIHRYCAVLLRDESQADDVLQTVFVEAHQTLARWQGRSTLRTWLFGIARHRCLDELRRKRRWRRIFLPLSSEEVARPGADPPSSSGQDPIRTHGPGSPLEECLGRLPAEARSLVLLRFREALSYEELAASTGQPAVTLRSRVCRSIAALRRCLERRRGAAA